MEAGYLTPCRSTTICDAVIQWQCQSSPQSWHCLDGETLLCQCPPLLCQSPWHRLRDGTQAAFQSAIACRWSMDSFQGTGPAWYLILVCASTTARQSPPTTPAPRRGCTRQGPTRSARPLSRYEPRSAKMSPAPTVGQSNLCPIFILDHLSVRGHVSQHVPRRSESRRSGPARTLLSSALRRAARTARRTATTR